jgi:hypothetical protein
MPRHTYPPVRAKHSASSIRHNKDRIYKRKQEALRLGGRFSQTINSSWRRELIITGKTQKLRNKLADEIAIFDKAAGLTAQAGPVIYLDTNFLTSLTLKEIRAFAWWRPHFLRDGEKIPRRFNGGNRCSCDWCHRSRIYIRYAQKKKNLQEISSGLLEREEVKRLGIDTAS